MQLHVEVRPRVVAPPWEREAKDGERTTFVGLEACVTPERGPLELYQSRWPERYVVWNRPRQLFEIRSHTDAGWREFVFLYDAPADPTSGVPHSPEALAQMIEAGDLSIRKVFRDFDYEFVHRRMREAMEYDEINRSSRILTQQVLAANRAIQTRDNKDLAARQAARLGEIRRYLPTLVGDEKIPLVPGASFTH